MTEQTDIPRDNLRLFPGSGQGTLTTAQGSQLPVRTFERPDEIVLVVLVDVDEHEEIHLHEPASLEYTSVRGVVKLHGEAVLEDRSLIRFRAHGEADVTQRRSFVRVTTPQAVALEAEPNAPDRRAHTVDLSGGGMLVSGANGLEPDDEVGFSIALGAHEIPVQGVARVVRVKEDGQRALVFDEIDEDDRQRLIRYVFECMRNARAKTRGDWS